MATVLIDILLAFWVLAFGAMAIVPLVLGGKRDDQPLTTEAVPSARTLADPQAWEAAPPLHAPRSLVVSTGSIVAHRDMGPRSPVVLDKRFTAGRAFGASGTPSAVLINAEGTIAADLAVGAPAVLALAGVNLEVSSQSG